MSAMRYEIVSQQAHRYFLYIIYLYLMPPATAEFYE